jgi:predicted CoA-binding protein
MTLVVLGTEEARVTEKAVVEDLLSQRTWAVVGVSRSGKKFGNAASRELRNRGYRMIPVHPEADSIDGERCYRSLHELPEQVGALLVVVPPSETEKIVREASEAGISRVWMQQGAESAAAIRHCNENGMSLVHGECILMFAGPTGVHKFHRWVWRLLGKLPQ